ncbi:MAG: tyrosine-protein phosphatase [Candidatus Pelagadaptatus aseana]|uniref:tyrosine-protein phosphatase n=1 Tax=Candidatus Pelagadaptatus aseana TaxID=3120508 RepID=UPI0039B25899
MDILKHPNRVLPLDGGINFRDLGGYRNRHGKTVKWKKLFRSGHLSNLSDQDIDQLEQLSLTRIHDFRRADEQQRAPSKPVRAEITNDYEMFVGSMSKFWEFLDNGGLNAESAHELVRGSYRDCIDDVAPAYRRLFLSLLDNADNASLFHCAAGKDRTGIAAALILSALEVDRDTIVQDYLLTLEHYDSERLLGVVEEHLRNANVSHWERSWLMPYVSVHQDNIEFFFDATEKQYGSVEDYLSDALDLDQWQLQDLQAAYLE